MYVQICGCSDACRLVCVCVCVCGGDHVRVFYRHVKAVLRCNENEILCAALESIPEVCGLWVGGRKDTSVSAHHRSHTSYSSIMAILHAG